MQKTVLKNQKKYVKKQAKIQSPLLKSGELTRLHKTHLTNHLEESTNQKTIKKIIF